MRLLNATKPVSGRIFALAALAIAVAWPAGAQKRFVREAPAFRSNSTLVVVPVTVMDRHGAIVNGLSGNPFTLTENGVTQPIKSFSEDDAPVSLGVVLDLSGSMKGVLGAAKESLRTMMKDANPDDELFLNGVSTQPRAYSGFEDSIEETMRRVESEKAEGYTALIDTIYSSVQELRAGVHPRKALLVISDGMDNHSRYTREELLRLAVESDSQIYTIATVAASNPVPGAKAGLKTEAQRGLSFLEELAARTGGISFVVSNGTEIAQAAARIDQALRNQYVIGFVPREDSGSGQWRKIRVKVAGSGLRAYARAGYRLD